MPVYAASYQLLNHLAFKDSSLMGRFGRVEYAPTTIIMIMIIIFIILTLKLFNLLTSALAKTVPQYYTVAVVMDVVTILL